MMKPTIALKNYIMSQVSIDDLAKKIDVSRQTLYNLVEEKSVPSGEVIAKLLKETGFDFEKAFEVEK